MKRYVLKMSFVLIICCILLFCISDVVSAGSMINGINNQIGQNSNTITSIFNTSNKILGAIEVVGTGIAIVMLMYIAIKYITVSPEGKAEYKKTAIAYVIGAAILFAAPKLVKVLMEIAQNITGKL